jgi:hypothetical protein
MDVGVGCFIVSGALVSRKARTANDSTQHKSRDQPKVTPRPGSPRADRLRKEKVSAESDSEHVSPVNSPVVPRAAVPRSRVQVLMSALKSMTLLLAVGLIRFTIIKALNYQVRV